MAIVINVVQFMLSFSNVLLSHFSSLGESQWLLSVPVISSGGDSEAGVRVDKWFLGLSKGKWLLSIPVISSGGDGEASVWVNKRIRSLC